MTYDQFIAARDDWRHPQPCYRVDAPSPRRAAELLREQTERTKTTVVRARARRVTTAAPRYRDGAPWKVCRCCHEPAHLAAGQGFCVRCQAEVTWRRTLAMRGFKVVP